MRFERVAAALQAHPGRVDFARAGENPDGTVAEGKQAVDGEGGGALIIDPHAADLSLQRVNRAVEQDDRPALFQGGQQMAAVRAYRHIQDGVDALFQQKLHGAALALLVGAAVADHDAVASFLQNALHDGDDLRDEEIAQLRNDHAHRPASV